MDDILAKKIMESEVLSDYRDGVILDEEEAAIRLADFLRSIEEVQT